MGPPRGQIQEARGEKRAQGERAPPLQHLARKPFYFGSVSRRRCCIYLRSPFLSKQKTHHTEARRSSQKVFWGSSCSTRGR